MNSMDRLAKFGAQLATMQTQLTAEVTVDGKVVKPGTKPVQNLEETIRAQFGVDMQRAGDTLVACQQRLQSKENESRDEHISRVVQQARKAQPAPEPKESWWTTMRRLMR